jgi:hypothetical protein
MPAKAGIHVFLCSDEGRTWIPAFAGMTGVGEESIVRTLGIIPTVATADS